MLINCINQVNIFWKLFFIPLWQRAPSLIESIGQFYQLRKYFILCSNKKSWAIKLKICQTLCDLGANCGPKYLPAVISKDSISCILYIGTAMQSFSSHKSKICWSSERIFVYGKQHPTTSIFLRSIKCRSTQISQIMPFVSIGTFLSTALKNSAYSFENYYPKDPENN